MLATIFSVIYFLWVLATMFIIKHYATKSGYLKGQNDLYAAIAYYVSLYDVKLELLKEKEHNAEEAGLIFADMLNGVLELLVDEPKLKTYAMRGHAYIKAKGKQKNGTTNSVSQVKGH